MLRYPKVVHAPHRTPVDMVQSYTIAQPFETHFKLAHCSEVECPAYQNGFTVTADESTELGLQQAWYIRNRAGRHYTEKRTASITVFTFVAGQRCFIAHPKSLEREPFYTTRRGDWRGYDGEMRVHKRAGDWADDFATNQDRLKKLLERA